MTALKLIHSESIMKAELNAISLRRAARKEKIKMLEERHHLLGQQLSNEKHDDLMDEMRERRLMAPAVTSDRAPRGDEIDQ